MRQDATPASNMRQNCDKLPPMHIGELVLALLYPEHCITNLITGRYFEARFYMEEVTVTTSRKPYNMKELTVTTFAIRGSGK